MQSAPALTDLLTAKAMLLLRQERELLGLREERARSELWMRVFHQLPLEFKAKTSDSLLRQWTELMVRELHFQVAAVYVMNEARRALGLECAQSHVPLIGELDADPEMLGFMASHPVGGYQRQDPAELDGLAKQVDLDSFFWFRLATRSRKLLLLCGFAPSAGQSCSVKAYDYSHFDLAGNHLAALLDNTDLMGELDQERSGLAQSNYQLEQAMSQLQKEVGERLQLERELRHAQKLEALGRMVAGFGHEINNPLAYVLSNLEYSRRELGRSVAEFDHAQWTALQDALDEAASGAQRIQKIVSATREFSRPIEEAPAVMTSITSSTRPLCSGARGSIRGSRPRTSVLSVGSSRPRTGRSVR